MWTPSSAAERIAELEAQVAALHGECSRWAARVKRLERRLARILDVATGREDV